MNGCFDMLLGMLRCRLPYLIVWKRGLRANYDKAALGQVQGRMLQLVHDLFDDGVHFLIYYNGTPEFWEEPVCKQLRGLPGVQMLQLGPSARCLCSLPCILEGLRGASSTSSTTTPLVMVDGLQQSLRVAGDERWCQLNYEDEAPTSGYQSWISGMNRDDLSEDFMLMWEPPGETHYGSWFLVIGITSPGSLCWRRPRSGCVD